MDKKVKSFAMHILRRGSYKWAPRSDVAKDARVSRGLYKCAMCGKEVRNKDKEIDHKIPVIDPVKGFTTFDDFIERLYCEKEGMQILCIDPCHKTKSLEENSHRTGPKRKKKQ